jgi:hypothetical protein
MVLCSSNLVLILPQPFLTPVPPIGSEILAKIALPFGYIIGSLRTVLILALGLAYVALVRGVCLALVNIMFLSKKLQALMSPGSCSTIIPISNQSPHIYNLSPYSPAGWCLVDTSGARDPETRASHHFPFLFVLHQLLQFQEDSTKQRVMEPSNRRYYCVQLGFMDRNSMASFPVCFEPISALVLEILHIAHTSQVQSHVRSTSV